MNISNPCLKTTPYFVSNILYLRVKLLYIISSEVQPDDWSDSDDEDPKTTDPVKRIQTLERKLALAKKDFVDYRELVSQKMNLKELLESHTEAEAGHSQLTPTVRDDDSHYFKSYGENGSYHKPLVDVIISKFCRYPRRHDPR